MDAQNIIDNAVDRSGLNDVALVNTPRALDVISSEQRGIYLLAAQLDPDYFGMDGLTSVRAAYTDSWDLTVNPGNVAVVTKAVIAAMTVLVPTGLTVGQKVNLAWFRNPDLEQAPRAYIRNRNLVPYGTELGTATLSMVTQLRVYYSPLPAIVTSASQTLALPDEWKQLLVLPLARVLSIRDLRAEETQVLDQEYTKVLGNFQSAVVAFAHGATRPLQQIPAIPMLSAQGAK